MLSSAEFSDDAAACRTEVLSSAIFWDIAWFMLRKIEAKFQVGNHSLRGMICNPKEVNSYPGSELA